MVVCALQALSGLRSTSLEQCYRHVEELPEKLEGLKQRFGLKSTQRLVHRAQLEMEKVTSERWQVERRSGPIGDGVVFAPAAGQRRVHPGTLPPTLGQTAAFVRSSQDGQG